MSSNVAAQKKMVEQLRVERNIQRKPVSECVKEMVAFMEENNSKDCLVNGFLNKKENPFVEKGGCTIL
jgi:hypothetical protein